VRNAKTEFSHSGFRTPQLRDNSNTAQKLFELMQQARIICVNQAAKEVSPSSAPLSTSWRGAGGEVSPRGRGEYVVQYPSELLRTKIGSSCDCALLYAALLENSNVPVALMVSDEHILVLFQRQEQIEVSPYLRLPHQGGGNYAEQPSNGEGVKEFVSWKNKFWIPLDIRMLKATFPEAKEAGMQAYEKLKQEGKVKPFILREAWEKYKPVRFVSPQSVKEMQLGITYVQHGEYEKAEQIFNRHLNDDASAAAYNNLGNISIRRGNYKEAESRYLEAIKTDPGDGAIYLNLGIAYTIANEDKEAEAMFDSAYSELGSYAQMCYALGIKLDGLEHKEMQLLLKEAENRALQSRTRPLGVRGVLDSKQLPLYWKRR
jgi:tetratricopeptide (TPR) repeat protein